MVVDNERFQSRDGKRGAIIIRNGSYLSSEGFRISLSHTTRYRQTDYLRHAQTITAARKIAKDWLRK